MSARAIDQSEMHDRRRGSHKRVWPTVTVPSRLSLIGALVYTVSTPSGKLSDRPTTRCNQSVQTRWLPVRQYSGSRNRQLSLRNKRRQGASHPLQQDSSNCTRLALSALRWPSSAETGRYSHAGEDVGGYGKPLWYHGDPMIRSSTRQVTILPCSGYPPVAFVVTRMYCCSFTACALPVASYSTEIIEMR